MNSSLFIRFLIEQVINIQQLIAFLSSNDLESCAIDYPIIYFDSVVAVQLCYDIIQLPFIPKFNYCFFALHL